MAKIYDQLLQPEEGWKRIDDTDSNIIYTGTWKTQNLSIYYNSTSKYSNENTATISFMYYGTKIRLMMVFYSTKSDGNIIEIDGKKYTFDCSNSMTSGDAPSLLAFDKQDLDKTVHSVKIYAPNASSSKNIHIDAIDIDKDGCLLTKEAYNYFNQLNIPTNEDIVFYKVKKENLPKTAKAKLAIYFTGNGEIYINDKDGNVVPAINFKTEFLSNNDYKTLQDNNNIDHSKLYMVATDETLNNTKKMNLYYNNQRYVVNNDTIDKSYEVQQKVSLNATPTEPIQIYTNDSNNKMIIDNYKFVEGENDVTSILKEFSNEKKSSFFYNNEEVNFNDTGVNIKNEYKLTDTLNNDTDLYESDIINKSDFIEINEVKLNG